MHLLLLPLRIPEECDDLAAQLSACFTNNTSSPSATTAATATADDDDNNDVAAASCSNNNNANAAQADDDIEADEHDWWEYVAALRRTVGQVLLRAASRSQEEEQQQTMDGGGGGGDDNNNNNYDDPALLDVLQEYASCLQQCCDHYDHHHQDRAAEENSSSSSSSSSSLTLPWHCGFTQQTETNGCAGVGWASWELANVIYNMICVYLRRALLLQQQQQQHTSPGGVPNRQAWTATAQHLQHAASLLLYLREHVLVQQQQQQQQQQSSSSNNSSALLHAPFLQIWETYCLAEAQYCTYCAFQLQPRPKHFLLAKLAAADLFQQVEELICAAPTAALEQQAAAPLNLPFLVDWEDSVRAWGMWMTTVSEYHQSLVHREKKEHGLEIARLEAALKFAGLCQEFCNQADSDLLDGLAGILQPVLEEMEERFELAQHENDNNNAAAARQPIPEHDELPEIAPQQIVKADLDAIHKLLPVSSSSRAMFNNNNNTAVTADPGIGRYVATFRSDIQNLIQESEQRAEEKTESARSQLASVHLPHALTVYRQELSNTAGPRGGSGGGGGGANNGIPDGLWQRVQDVQREQRTVEHLKQDLWQLQDMADTARTTFQRIGEVLEEDLELDSMFRRQNPMFEGHDVQDIQKAFRQALQNYHRLMVSANESDTLLIRRSEALESDPKFRLLHLARSQLDRLESTATRQSEIDVSQLSALLVDLSSLFNDRDKAIQRLHKRYETYSIAQDLGACQSEAEYPQVLEDAAASFQELVDKLEENLEQQGNILCHIMQENDQFLQLREQASREAANDNVVVKLEDALEELELFSKHLREGRTFYDVVIPKLEKLQHQVQDVSNRLAQERQDHEDYNASRSRSQIGSGGRYSGGGGGGASNGMMSGGGGGYDPRGGGGGGAGGYDSRGGSGGGGGDGPRSRFENGRPSQRGTVPQSSYGNGQETEVLVDDEKVANLVAMDFDPEKVVAALKRNDNNLEQALNDLLSC